MNLVQMIGAGAVIMVGGGVLAWSLDDRPAQASIAKADEVAVA